MCDHHGQQFIPITVRKEYTDLITRIEFHSSVKRVLRTACVTNAVLPALDTVRNGIASMLLRWSFHSTERTRQ